MLFIFDWSSRLHDRVFRSCVFAGSICIKKVIVPTLIKKIPTIAFHLITTEAQGGQMITTQGLTI